MNNRIIKFRVWDTISKNFLTSESTPTKNDRLIFYWNSELKGYTFNGEVIIQQFTGLQDLNNKEIFEGDIVESHLGVFPKHGHFSPIYEVIFQYGKFRLKHIKSQETSIDFSPHNFNNTLKSEELEIIGNIFENPESLS